MVYRGLYRFPYEFPIISEKYGTLGIQHGGASVSGLVSGLRTAWHHCCVLYALLRPVFRRLAAGNRKAARATGDSDPACAATTPVPHNPSLQHTTADLRSIRRSHVLRFQFIPSRAGNDLSTMDTGGCGLLL